MLHADYTTVHDPTQPSLSSDEQAAVYAELASGAETGWDYSTRWMKDPNVGLRTLDIRNLVPVDLNSILCTSPPCTIIRGRR
jgi:alpha,alpha-trehalase